MTQMEGYSGQVKKDPLGLVDQVELLGQLVLVVRVDRLVLLGRRPQSVVLLGLLDPPLQCQDHQAQVVLRVRRRQLAVQLAPAAPADLKAMRQL